MVEEKRSDRRQSGSFFLAGNFGLCSEIVGVLAWRCEHRIRRREDLLFSFGSERGPFPKDGAEYLGCRPPLSPAWRISPGCPWIDNFRRFGIRFDNTFLLLLHGLFVSFAFCFCVNVSISTSTVFSASLQEQPAACTRGTDTFSVLAHSFSPFVSHFDTHFLHLGDSPVLCGSTQSYVTYACKSRDLKAAESGFHFGPCAVRFIHWVACMVLFFANHGTPSF